MILDTPNEKVTPQKSRGRKILDFIIIIFVVTVLISVLIAPTGGSGHFLARRSAAMQTARAISIALHAYSVDHSGHYPDGVTSTEVFQHLIDEQYVTDPSIFFISSMITFGKIHPEGMILKPANVCWDITSSVDSSSPDNLPVVFLTGYKITYQSGAEATAFLVESPPNRTWNQWWNGVPLLKPFMAVAYKDSSAKWFESNEDGSIPNFIPADFDAKGKTYRQLTP